MKYLSLAFVAIMGVACPVYSQYASVNFDLEKNYFNEGQPLPAEKNLMFTGLVPPGVDIIEISILPAKAKNDNRRLYLASWKDFDNSANTNFSIAVNSPLRASEKYDFRLDYFRKLNTTEQVELNERIVALANDYLEANISIKGNAINLAKSEKKIVEELNEIVQQALSEYRSQDGLRVEQFSETIKQKLAQIGNVEFGKMPKDTLVNQEENKRATAVSTKMSELETAITTEIQRMLDKSWSKLATSRYVDDYETEQKKGFFSLNVGYGGVFLDGKLDDFTYGASPYLGVSFPLGNSTLAPKFMRNSSITIGAFLQNFEDKAGNKVSGIIVDRPLYLGLDYKLFEFVRFNAGAAFMERTEKITTSGGVDIIETNKTVWIRPFIGISAKIDLSIGFGK